MATMLDNDEYDESCDGDDDGDDNDDFTEGS